jgi:hypothetical protein
MTGTRTSPFLSIISLVIAFLVLLPAPARAIDTVQPGDYMETSVGACTLSFVYDGLGAQAGKVFIGTAAHCVSKVGQAVRDEFGQTFGRVALIGNGSVTAQDYALIQVTPGVPVSAAVKGWSSFPKGYTTSAETKLGDVVLVSGYGLGFNFLAATREKRYGAIVSDTSAEYRVVGLDTFGDSGGPFVHQRTGKAYGIVSRLCIGLCTSQGPTVEGILSKAAARGFTIRLRTV